MCENSPYQIKFAYPDATVTVKDLWEVYPELSTGDEAVFAKEVRDAADFNRKHEALHHLRDQFDDGAIASALENGATFPEADDYEPDQPSVVALSPTDRRLLDRIADALKDVGKAA